MSALQVIADVTPETLPEYPLDGSERLESHWFMPWARQRWLNSDMRLRGDPEARAYHFDLICMSFDHQPIGTLPRDPKLLARLVYCDADRFVAMCAMPYGPLHRFKPCRCGDEVRLMHPVILETLLDAIVRKEDNRAAQEAASARKRLIRVRERLAQIDASLASNDKAVRWIDAWFEEQGIKRRDDRQWRAAMTAWAQATARGERVF